MTMSSIIHVNIEAVKKMVSHNRRIAIKIVMLIMLVYRSAHAKHIFTVVCSKITKFLAS